ncbi:MAG: hypothetical protein AB7V77_03450 [Candidatus Woesearchaeota archaeon]
MAKYLKCYNSEESNIPLDWVKKFKDGFSTINPIGVVGDLKRNRAESAYTEEEREEFIKNTFY